MTAWGDGWWYNTIHGDDIHVPIQWIVLFQIIVVIFVFYRHRVGGTAAAAAAAPAAAAAAAAAATGLQF